MPYAPHTRVSPQKSRMEIENLLTKNGATRIGFMMEQNKAQVVFDMADRRVRFVITIKDRGSKAKTEQQERTSWRALLLCIKAKINSIQTGVETFEEAFLAHVVTPDGETVYERLRPQLKQLYGGGSSPLLLEHRAPSGGGG